MSAGTRFFITGAGGFVGSAVAGHLREAGHAVVAADLRGAPLELSVLDAGALVSAAREARPSIFVHGAALTTASLETGLDLVEVNVRGTLNALEAALASGARHFVLLSSAGVYEPRPGPIDEDGLTSSASPYALSKLLAERAAELVGRTTGLSVWLLRLGPVYGPGEAPSGSRRNTSLVHQIAWAVLENRPAILACRPGDVFDWLHTSDVARLLERIASQAGAGGPRLYNASGPGVTVLDLLGAFGQVSPGADLGGLVSWNPSPPLRRGPMDCSRLERDMGFRPVVPLERGLADYLESAVRPAPRPEVRL